MGHDGGYPALLHSTAKSLGSIGSYWLECPLTRIRRKELKGTAS